MMSLRVSIIVLLMLFGSVEAQIYRCETEGSTVFSDRPCGEDARPFEASSRVSYVAPDDSLPELAASAKAFIAQRRARLAHSRAAPPAAWAPETDPQPVHLTTHRPWLYHGQLRRARHGAPAKTPAQPPAPPRYSALNGPILGTRGTAPFRVRLSEPADRDSAR